MDEWESYFIRGYEYEVNRDGVIRRASTGRILKPRLNHDGYWVVTMGPTKGRIQRHVHRLVGELWVPNPEGLQDVDHIDFDRQNCCADNLQWIDHFSNVKRSCAVGHYKGMPGESNPNARTDEETVRMMRKDFANGATRYAIGKKYGVSWTQTDRICKGKSWSGI